MRRNSNNNVLAEQRRRVICSAGSHPRPGLRAPGASDFIPFLVEERSENKRQQPSVLFYCFLPPPSLLIPLAAEHALDRKQTRSSSQIFRFFVFICFPPLPTTPSTPSLSPQHQRPDFQLSLDRLAFIIQAFFFL